MSVASAFGGPIFIDLGADGTDFDDPAPNLGQVTVECQNVVEHPYFKLSIHSNSDWINQMRDKPVPYAVFESDKLIVVQKTGDSASLDDPVGLMEWWDSVFDLQDDLAGRTRTSPELVNVDVQIEWGSAHAGYPVAAWDVYWDNLADHDKLLQDGSWGTFHEIGHNHQRSWWTFDDPGDVEVTVNIFSAYCFSELTPGSSDGWKWTVDPIQVMDKAKIAISSSGGTYAAVDDLSHRLAFWLQLAYGFGWEKMKEVLTNYESQPPSSNLSELDKHDEWLIRYSQATGYDLTKFMIDTWGLTVSSGAKSQVNSLPSWMPIVGGLSGTFVITEDSTKTFDLVGVLHSLDDNLEISSITQGSHGSVTEVSTGSYKYTPSAGFVGSDNFYYTARSSAGNTVTFQIGINVVASNQECFQLAMRTDDYGSETSWALTDSSNTLVASGDSYENNIDYEYENCLLDDANECYTFVILDAANDGICCFYGTGQYTLSIGSKVIGSGGDFASSDTVAFGNCDGEPTTSPPTSQPTNPPTPQPTTPPTTALPTSSTSVSCGGHFASVCSQCPICGANGESWCGSSWCNGDCSWLHDECVLTASLPEPTPLPTPPPTSQPTTPTTSQPTTSPTSQPTNSPTKHPTRSPTTSPTTQPTNSPTKPPTRQPTISPTRSPTKAPTSKPTPFPTSAPTTPQTTGGCPTAEESSLLKFSILTDNYGYETSWELVVVVDEESNNGNTNLLSSGGRNSDGTGDQLEDNTTYETEVCINIKNKCHKLTISDSYGDGICCNYGMGSYEIYLGSDLIADGGEFGSNEEIEIGNCPSTGEEAANCGGHIASSCSECPICGDNSWCGSNWCNGDCMWINNACVPK